VLSSFTILEDTFLLEFLYLYNKETKRENERERKRKGRERERTLFHRVVVII
jgi:hypothetical protein